MAACRWMMACEPIRNRLLVDRSRLLPVWRLLLVDCWILYEKWRVLQSIGGFSSEPKDKTEPDRRPRPYIERDPIRGWLGNLEGISFLENPPRSMCAKDVFSVCILQRERGQDTKLIKLSKRTINYGDFAADSHNNHTTTSSVPHSSYYRWPIRLAGSLYRELLAGRPTRLLIKI